MPTFLFYPRRVDGVSLTFIAEAAANDRGALELADEIADAHDCASVFVYETMPQGEDRLVGEVRRKNATARQSRSDTPQMGA